MKKILIALALSLLGTAALAQPGVVASPRWKPPVANLAALPATGNTIGDTRIALDTMVHWTWDGDSWETAASGGGAGTVTSVALAVPAEWTVSGSPITGAGTITIAEATQAANTVYAGPASGGAAAPGFRSLVSADVPNNAADTTGNAATATALAANGTNCDVGQYARGMDASGNAESCTADDTGTDDQTAGEVAYTPTTGTDWTDPDPASVGEGLDDLAARLTIEEAKADDDVPESGDFGNAADLEADGSLSADVVAAAEMADADHGDVSWSGGVATVQDLQCSDCIGGTEIDESSLVISGFLTGSIGATDNAILRADTVGGGVQTSAVTIADTTGDMNFPSNAKITVTGTATSYAEIDYISSTRELQRWFFYGYNDGAGNYERLQINGGNGSSGAAIAQEGAGTGTKMLTIAGAPLHLNAGSGQSVVIGYQAATNLFAFRSGGLASRSDQQFFWSSTSSASGGAVDTGFARESAGVARVTNASTGIGSLLASRVVEASTAGSGAPNVLAANESNKVFTNEGATAASYFTLPAAVAGLYFPEFVVADADGLRVTAAAGDVIHLSNGQTSTAGGYCESTTQWTSTSAQAINATDWYGKVSGTGWTCDGP